MHFVHFRKLSKSAAKGNACLFYIENHSLLVSLHMGLILVTRRVSVMLATVALSR